MQRPTSAPCDDFLIAFDDDPSDHCKRSTWLGLLLLALVLLTPRDASGALFDPPVTEVTAPSGKKGYSLKCSGFGRTIEDCYKKAGEICPNGYDIENTSRTVQGIPQATGSTIIVSKEYMLISCKDKAPDDGTPDQKSPPVQDQPAP